MERSDSIGSIGSIRSDEGEENKELKMSSLDERINTKTQHLLSLKHASETFERKESIKIIKHEIINISSILKKIDKGLSFIPINDLEKKLNIVENKFESLDKKHRDEIGQQEIEDFANDLKFFQEKIKPEIIRFVDIIRDEYLSTVGKEVAQKIKEVLEENLIKHEKLLKLPESMEEKVNKKITRFNYILNKFFNLIIKETNNLDNNIFFQAESTKHIVGELRKTNDAILRDLRGAVKSKMKSLLDEILDLKKVEHDADRYKLNKLYPDPLTRTIAKFYSIIKLTPET
ncbi:MAG: hypothetical protein WD512_05935, partial [Candidatus Paceibacterota bacterium]